MKTFLISCLLLGVNCLVNAQQFRVHYKSSVYKGSFSGNVILYLSRKNEQPKDQTGWPCYRMEVRNIKPGQAVVFSDSSLSYPTLLSRIDRGEYNVQAVWDLNIEGRVIGKSMENPYSISRKVSLNDPNQVFDIVCDQAVEAPVFEETMFCKEIKAPSALLSRFHHKPVSLNAAVILPAQYFKEPNRHFPVLFTFGGYGGYYHHYSSKMSSDTLPANPIDTIACIRVYLDGDCSLGHSVYANSDNNGPVGDAFTREFLPFLDQKFRTNGGRVIRGHSSGGYTVAHLLIHYPKFFAGGNASAPDPVDFHRFILTNLYTDAKRVEFVDALTIGKKPEMDEKYDRPNIMHSIEDIIYRGEQNVSFSAVFGPKGKNHLPKPLFNSATGELDKKVFEYWKRYDLTQYVIKNWPKLKKELDGKLRISVGNEDNAFLNFSAMLMEAEMKKLGAGIKFEYYPGTHFTVGTPEYKQAELMWLKTTYEKWLALQE